MLLPVILFLLPPNPDGLNFVHRFVVSGAAKKWKNYDAGLPKEERALIHPDSLTHMLNFYEKFFIAKIFAINPVELGFKGKFYSKELPVDPVKIPNTILTTGKDTVETGVQYYPRHAYRDYLRMMEKMRNDLGKQLYIDSGYRSPGRQALLFIYYLATSSHYVLRENAKWIAMPGYSEHGSPIYTAIDFITVDGINGFSGDQTQQDFAGREEYKWLQENAKEFNFYLSYPEGNSLGVAFEPWHWHWEGDTSIYNQTEVPQIK